MVGFWRRKEGDLSNVERKDIILLEYDPRKVSPLNLIESYTTSADEAYIIDPTNSMENIIKKSYENKSRLNPNLAELYHNGKITYIDASDLSNLAKLKTLFKDNKAEEDEALKKAEENESYDFVEDNIENYFRRNDIKTTIFATELYCLNPHEMQPKVNEHIIYLGNICRGYEKGGLFLVDEENPILENIGTIIYRIPDIIGTNPSSDGKFEIVDIKYHNSQ